MNESLAKQLHDIISNAKWNIKDSVSEEMICLENEIHNLINQKEQENTNE